MADWWCEKARHRWNSWSRRLLLASSSRLLVVLECQSHPSYPSYFNMESDLKSLIWSEISNKPAVPAVHESSLMRSGVPSNKSAVFSNTKKWDPVYLKGLIWFQGLLRIPQENSVWLTWYHRSPNNMECVPTFCHNLIHFHESDEWTEYQHSFWLPKCQRQHWKVSKSLNSSYIDLMSYS